MTGLPDASPELDLVQVLDPAGRVLPDSPFAGSARPELARDLYRWMVLARRLDQEAYNRQRQGELGLWLSCRGQEAAQIGSVSAFRTSDHIFPACREQAVGLYRGISPGELLSSWRGCTHGGWDPARDQVGDVALSSAFPAGRGGDAADLVFECMAATLAEKGRRIPSGIAERPAVLRRECSSLHDVYRPPGVFLIAHVAGQPAGCVSLSALPGGHTAEVSRLYVRPAHRANGIARALMSHAHHHAARQGMTRLILDVLPGRTAAIGFYRRLGYIETGPFETESPEPMIYMERAGTMSNILSGP